MRELFLDCETIPSQDPAVRAEIDAKHAVADTLPEIRADARLTDPAKIAADITKRTDKATIDLAAAKVAAAAAADTEWRRTSLDGALGHVFSVAWAWGDGPVQRLNLAYPVSIVSTSGDPAEIAAFRREIVVEAEMNLLDGLFRSLERDIPLVVGHDWIVTLPHGYTTEPSMRFVAHHAQFDLRVLWQRAVALGVPPPWWWPIDAKPWDRDRVYDTMTAWAGIGGKIKLDALCRALGLPGKEGFDGAAVWDAVRDGRGDDVVAYNIADVERLRAVYKRLTFAQQSEDDAIREALGAPPAA